MKDEQLAELKRAAEGPYLGEHSGAELIERVRESTLSMITLLEMLKNETERRKSAEEALENMRGAFDTPMVRRRVASDFHTAAIDSARAHFTTYGGRDE